MQQEQHSVVWQNFDFLFEALHATGFTGEGDLSEAAAVEIRCVVLPGEGLHGLQPVLHFIPLWRRNGKCESEFSQKRDKDNLIKSHRGQETISFSQLYLEKWMCTKGFKIKDLTCHKVSPLWCWVWRSSQSYTDWARPHWAYPTQYSP